MPPGANPFVTPRGGVSMPGEYRARIQMGSGGSGGSRSFEAVDGGAAPSDQSMRQLRRLDAAAVAVVTFRDDRGFRGVTVTAFCVVSLSPPRVLVCLARGGEALAAILASGSFAVNVLADTQEFLAEQFAGRAPLVNPRFAGVKHRLVASGNPVLEECLAWYDCAVASRHNQGDHDIVVGDVRAAGQGAGAEPLIYFDGDYRSLEA
jgi:flavin reductase (DIM6/NTAB) family NADH-FMN oxidoreductase RutF